MRLRGLSGARNEFLLAATVQNFKTLAANLWAAAETEARIGCIGCLRVGDGVHLNIAATPRSGDHKAASRNTTIEPRLFSTASTHSGRQSFHSPLKSAELNSCMAPPGVTWSWRRLSISVNDGPSTSAIEPASWRMTGRPLHRSGPSGANVPMITCPPGPTAARTHPA